MDVEVCRKKVSHIEVTDTDLDYVEGSLTLGRDIMDTSGLKSYEKVLVINLASGDRFETYLIRDEEHERRVCLNGGTARLGKQGDELIVLSFGHVPEEEVDGIEPDIFYAGENNNLEPRQ